MNFEMIGHLSIGKQTDKFSPFEERQFDSGWVRKQLRFNAQCGDNRHMLQVTSGSFADGHGDVHTFTKSYTDDDGNKVKGEYLKIPFKDRLTSPKIAEVAEFKKFVFDLEKPGRRYKLQTLADKIKDGKSLTDDDLKEVGLTSEEEVNDALAASEKKRHEFISEWDYVDFIKKVIDSGKYKDSKFLIRGNGEYSYSENKKQVYENLVPNRIYLAADDAEEMSEATINLLFSADSLDTDAVEEKNRFYVNGWSMEYESNLKKNIPVPMTISVDAANDGDAKAKKKANVIKKKFEVDESEIKEYGVVVKMVNGAQKTEITEDMLTDEQKEDLDAGLITMDDIRAELGGSVYGDRIKENLFLKPARGFTKGTNSTVYTAEDMVIKTVSDDELDTDLFDDDDEI